MIVIHLDLPFLSFNLHVCIYLSPLIIRSIFPDIFLPNYLGFFNQRSYAFNLEFDKINKHVKYLKKDTINMKTDIEMIKRFTIYPPDNIFLI